MDIPLLVVKIAQTVRQYGLRATIYKVRDHFTRSLASDEFDVTHGTDTGGIEPLWKFHIGSTNARFGGRYQATDEEELVDAVNTLRADLRAFTFIDLGCGKGRTLLIASKLGFGQVVGVEFARELVETARGNLRKLRITNGVVVHGDAADFRFPKGDLVVYLYNPFSKDVMEKVVGNLRESRSDRLYVIYKVAECSEVFDSSGFLRRFGRVPTRRYIEIWTTTNVDKAKTSAHREAGAGSML